MKEGLEGFVEFLLPELAFAGEQGLSVDDFMALTKQYFNQGKNAVLPAQEASGSHDSEGPVQASLPRTATAQTKLDDAETAFARGAWNWLVARPNVLVGGSRRWNKLSLDDVLALPEAIAPGEATTTPVGAGTPAPLSTPAPENNPLTGFPPAAASTPAISNPHPPGATFATVPSAPGDTPATADRHSQAPTPAQQKRAPKLKYTLTTRPRIQVTEETVWQAITGHGVDYKQIPRLEWHLLQGIAPTKHEGILQGDLRRLVGQDKRSVPKRTDFLAAKGYIVKRSIMVRASKTSKLWLAGFAPSTTAEGSEGSQAKDVKMTKEILTRDLSPVPWHAKWTGVDIDVETFAESVISIVKAWGVMRYSDIRLKMGIEELRWQMRVMARLTRSLVDMGIIKYTAATFANSRKVWKDCIKFIRDPSEAEWAKILATGKKTSKYTDLSKDRQPKPFALSLADKATPQPQGTPTGSVPEDSGVTAHSKPTTSGVAGWVPEKPLQQTLFDAVEAAGPEGATNPQISASTVGYNFRRYVGTMLTNMSMCKQPPHLEKFQLHRKLVRVDKTSAFIYTTHQFAQAATSQEQLEQVSTPVQGEVETPSAALTKTSTHGFRAIQRDKLAGPSASLSEISRTLRGRHRQHAPPKRPLAEVTSGGNDDDRSTKRRRVGGAQDGLVQPGPIERLPGKPPGAYIGDPGSLNPHAKRTGRPKRSLVLIFRSDKLKDLAFWKNGLAATQKPDESAVNVQYNGIPGKLCLNQKEKTVVFFREPQPPGKEPLTIRLDDVHEEPVVRPVPGCDDNSLVFVTKETSSNPAWNFVFLFKDDGTSQERVAQILKGVKSIANGEPIEDDSPTQSNKAEADASSAAGPVEADNTPQEPNPPGPAQAVEGETVSDASVVAQAQSSVPPWKAMGSGKGRSKKGASSSGQRPWRCEKCGNSWKNDIGLKYHLTKAQVPCNPDFVAQPAVPLPSKRKRPPTLPPGFGERASDGAEEESADYRRTSRRGLKPPKRWEVRLEHSGVPAFRGLTIDQSYLTGAAEPASRAKAVEAPSASPLEVPRPVVQSGVGLSGNGQSSVTSLVLNVPTAEIGDSAHPGNQHGSSAHDKAATALLTQNKDTIRRTPPRHIAPPGGDKPAKIDGIFQDESLVQTGASLRHEPLIQDEKPAKTGVSMPDIGQPREEIVRAALDTTTTATSPVKRPEAFSLPTPTTSASRAPEVAMTTIIQSQYSDSQPQAPASQSEMQVPMSAVSKETMCKETSVRTHEKPEASVLQLQPLDSAHLVDEAGSGTQGVGPVAGPPSTPVKAKVTHKRRPLPDKPTKREQEQLESGPTPFKPASHYAHLSTDSKIRTAQALDIVEYLLQSNGGIFPGDKALFYAVLRIYLKAFSGQMPPSFNNLRVACRRLMAKGKAREIVHAFRTSTGKFITSSMLLATEIDPNSIVPSVVKRKIQEAYPGVFIPPAFSPSKEELRLLEEFDREPAETEVAEVTPKSGGKFRGRRGNMEVEIMHAPYYQENPPDVGGQHLPAASGKATPVASPAIDEKSKKRRKRASTQSAVDQGSSRSAKKQKTLGSKLLGLGSLRKQDEDSVRDVSEDDMADAEPLSPERDDVNLEPPTMDSTPIASAIKAYGLLPPPRAGVKKRRPVDGLVKLPREVGRAQNPGLSTLPYFFFTNRYDDYWSHHTHSTSLTFLEPNIRLDDYHVTSWFENLDESGAFLAEDTSSTATNEEEMSAAEEEQVERVEGFPFVPAVTLKECSKGCWPKNPPVEFFDKSVQMLGWTPSPHDVLHDLLPADIHEMASWNKRKHVRIDLFDDAAFTRFSELIDRCEGWELSSKGTEIMGFGTLAPEYRFINASPAASVCQLQPVAPMWDEKNHFTLETFPYELSTTLAGDEDEELTHKKPPRLDLLGRKPRGRPPGKNASPKKDPTNNAQEPKEKKRMGRKPKRIRLPALEAEREHTAYPQSAEEYMDIHHGEERTPEWNSEHTQLAAFVCVTTLLGGVAKSVDWGIMMRLFPDMSLSHLRKFFGEMNKDRKSTIIDLTQKFQKAFLEAYEKGELPTLDYDNVLAYDWKALTLWTRSLAGDESTLPPSYADLEKRDMVVSDRAHQPRDWRETFWLPARSLYNRYQDSSSQAFATVIDSQVGIEEEDDNLRAAMSWVRALCVTAPHPPEVVSDKWETFKGLPRATISDLIDKSIRILQERLVITKDKNLIVMRLNDRVVKALDKAAQDQKFAEAARFKHRLDKAFRKGKERYRIPYTADDDGLTMALLNLQAHGRVTVETDNKNVPLGYEPFNYETRKFDRKYHHFRLWAVPTESYLYSTIPANDDRGVDNELALLLSHIQATGPPLEGSRGELPLWVDFFGHVNEVRWRKCLGAVLFILSTRGPMRADAIADQLKCFMPFEVQMILDWADRVGLLEQMTPGAPECVTEWWWLAVEAQRRRAAGAREGTNSRGKERAEIEGMDIDGTGPSVLAQPRT